MEFKSEEETYKWYFWQCCKEALSKIWWKVWNARLLLWWHRLWIREDEFDRSLEWDDKAYIVMSREKRGWYDRDLAIRRQIAHQREMRGIKGIRIIAQDVFGHLRPTSEWQVAQEHMDYIITHKDDNDSP